MTTKSAYFFEPETITDCVARSPRWVPPAPKDPTLGGHRHASHAALVGAPPLLALAGVEQIIEHAVGVGLARPAPPKMPLELDTTSAPELVARAAGAQALKLVDDLCDDPPTARWRDDQNALGRRPGEQIPAVVRTGCVLQGSPLRNCSWFHLLASSASADLRRRQAFRGSIRPVAERAHRARRC